MDKTTHNKMVTNQIVPNILPDSLITKSLLEVDRGLFFDTETTAKAYIDANINLGPAFPNKNIISSLNLAKMLQVVNINPDDKVLEIGCVNGYASCVMASIARVVKAVDTSKELLSRANIVKDSLDLANLEFSHVDNLNNGLSRYAPYSLIFINGAVTEVPNTIISQLDNGGRLIVPIIKDRFTHNNVLAEITIYVKNFESVSKISLQTINMFELKS